MNYLLPVALKVFRTSFIYRMTEKCGTMSDGGGKYAYVFKDYVLVAKGYNWNGVVSIHKNAWDKCMKENKTLVMFVPSPGGLYTFDVKKIKGTFENLRDGAIMINFNFEHGKRIGSENGFLDNSESIKQPESVSIGKDTNARFIKGAI